MHQGLSKVILVGYNYIIPTFIPWFISNMSNEVVKFFGHPNRAL
jgi:hypothetical protein